jgi:hypothetical protein
MWQYHGHTSHNRLYAVSITMYALSAPSAFVPQPAGFGVLWSAVYPFAES